MANPLHIDAQDTKKGVGAETLQTRTWGGLAAAAVCRVGQNRIHTAYITVYLMESLPKIPYIHRICIWSWPPLAV
jgi:hypothetical protein